MRMDWKSKAENLVHLFCESKKNSNCLLELEEFLLFPDEKCVLATFEAVSTVFSKIFSKGLMTLSSDNDKNKDYKLWLLNRYEDFVSHIVGYLSYENKEIQVSALGVLMSFVQLESKYSCRCGLKDQTFPCTLFQQIISGLLSDALDQSHLILTFKKYSCHDDVKLYSLKSIQAFLNESDQVTDLCLQNCISLLCSIEFPPDFNSSSLRTFASQSETGMLQIKEKPFRKMFSSAWSCVLGQKLPADMLKKVLSVLNESILPHFQNPCFLADFLTSAYSAGGVLSLLALKGLFILINKHNLEYTDFFVKLYALLDSRIINGKFGTQFFYLCNLFLASTHLPAHVVAAFTKKLSRLSLVSSVTNIQKIIALIANLLANHPALELLLHQTDDQEYAEDCFNWDVEDPVHSNALLSSLWEIKTLKSHVNPEVCFKAKELTDLSPKFADELPKESLHDVYQKQRKRKFEDVPLAIQKPYVQLKKHR